MRLSFHEHCVAFRWRCMKEFLSHFSEILPADDSNFASPLSPSFLLLLSISAIYFCQFAFISPRGLFFLFLLLLCKTVVSSNCQWKQMEEVLKEFWFLLSLNTLRAPVSTDSTIASQQNRELLLTDWHNTHNKNQKIIHMLMLKRGIWDKQNTRHVIREQKYQI